MACNFSFGSSLSLDILPTKPKSKNSRNPQKFLFFPPFSCKNQTFYPENEDKNQNTRKTHLNVLTIPVTLTIISTSLAQKPSFAATTVTSDRKKKSQKRTQEAWTPGQVKRWSKDLPIVSDRIAYTEILSLKQEGKLKHVIKSPAGALKQKAEPVLVVLEDSRVLRTVLPSLDNNQRFWESWDELKIDSLCVNAYSPPVKKPEVPKPYLGFFWRVPAFMLSFLKPKKESKRAAEIRKAREELKRKKVLELGRSRDESEMIDKAIKMQKKEEERRKKMEIRQRKYEKAMEAARMNSEYSDDMWVKMARDTNVQTVLGVVFFVIFYRTVVLSYNRQKKDYEDRLKIEKAEAEERKKMRQLERELEGLASVDNVDDLEKELGEGEENQYLKMAAQFMKSGARVRRAHGRRLPQYLERGVDVKFSDVAGLGKIRLELEEIVKFFTHGEVYRRRGVRIPGQILQPS